MQNIHSVSFKVSELVSTSGITGRASINFGKLPNFQNYSHYGFSLTNRAKNTKKFKLLKP